MDEDMEAEKACPRANGAKRRSGRKPGARVTNSARLFTPGETKALAESKVHQISRAWVTNDGWSIEIINNTRGGIVMFIQAKKGNASNGGQKIQMLK